MIKPLLLIAILHCYCIIIIFNKRLMHTAAFSMYYFDPSNTD